MTQIIIILILTLINAFFAAAEMAMVSINKNRLAVLVEEGDKRAVLLNKLLDEPSKLLATIQVGITFAGFFSSAFAATGLSVDFGVALSEMGIPYGRQIALVLITVLLSFIMLLFGELFPKRLALQKTETVALTAVRPVYYVSRLTKPFVMLLSGCTNMLIRALGMDHQHLDQRVSEEEIRSMVKVGQEFGVINQTEKQMINAIFEFDDKLAREVMTPRMDVIMVDLSVPADQYLEELIQLKHSRIPVYRKDKDQPLGVVHLKDLLVAAKTNGFDGVHIDTLIRSPFFVPETMSIDKLFIRLQREHEHMALLIDEYGMMTGIVTMEDLIEEVMGEIEDEFDETVSDVVVLEEGKFSIEGGLPLYDFNEAFHTHLECDNADTIGGYLIGREGQLPEELMGKVIRVEGFDLEVIEAENQRIRKLLVTKVKD